MTSSFLAIALLFAASAAGESFPPGPPKTDGPVIVRASFDLRDINNIDEEAETFEFEGVLTLSWQDARLSFDPADLGVDEKVYQGAYQFNEIFGGWSPQVVLVNESGLFESQGVVLRVRSDGSLTLIQTLNATAETDLDMRRYPFDGQRLDAIFEVLGFDETEVVLQPESSTSRASANVDRTLRLPQWEILQVRASVLERSAPYAGSTRTASTLVVSVDLKREPFFMVRLVVLPLMLMVMLSWSVFWMERSSLGDRISVSFIGILTAVAYQMVVSEILPQISYFTLINGILNLSFVLMCSTVVINLVVGTFDKAGRIATGDLIDRRCRVIFPLTYFGLILLMLAIAFLFFPDARNGA
jgi:hypothetical protein